MQIALIEAGSRKFQWNRFGTSNWTCSRLNRQRKNASFEICGVSRKKIGDAGRSKKPPVACRFFLPKGKPVASESETASTSQGHNNENRNCRYRADAAARHFGWLQYIGSTPELMTRIICVFHAPQHLKLYG
jgi:hypothetical protein